MSRAARTHLLLSAIALTAMVTRVGWINWPLIGTVTGLLVVALLVFAIMPALVIGILPFFVVCLADWLFKPVSAAREAEPPPYRMAVDAPEPGER